MRCPEAGDGHPAHAEQGLDVGVAGVAEQACPDHARASHSVAALACIIGVIGV
jgi:hypothetical protein